MIRKDNEGWLLLAVAGLFTLIISAWGAAIYFLLYPLSVWLFHAAGLR